MFRKLLLVVFAVVAANGVFAQSTSLTGKVKDKATGEAIPFANVVVTSGETILGGTATDFEGNYTIKLLPPGSWTVKASAVGSSEIATDAVGSDEIIADAVGSDEIVANAVGLSEGLRN